MFVKRTCHPSTWFMFLYRWMEYPVYKHKSRRWVGCPVCKHKSRTWMACPVVDWDVLFTSINHVDGWHIYACKSHVPIHNRTCHPSTWFMFLYMTFHPSTWFMFVNRTSHPSTWFMLVNRTSHPSTWFMFVNKASHPSTWLMFVNRHFIHLRDLCL
jgi:hypothetical protein